MHYPLIIDLLLLLVVANGTPVILAMLLRDRFDWPLDGARRFIDGRPLLGSSKTLRGVLGAVAVTALLAPALGLDRLNGALFGLLAMGGDLFSSFVKRRLGYNSGCTRPLLDQLPESCLPLWLLQPVTGAGLYDMTAAVAAFTALDLLASRLYRPNQAQCK